MTGKQMVKHLESHGFYVDRVNGSHHIMKNDETERTTTVPVHGNKQLGKGLEKAILKQAGLG